MKRLSDRDSIFFSALMILLLCGGCAKGEPTRGDLFPPNSRPVAKIADISVVSSGAVVQLDGSNSFDPESKPITFEWTFAQKPVGSLATLDEPTSSTPKFTADTDGVYRVSLRVVEEPDASLPAGVPLANQGLSSTPAEVMIVAGIPGPFPDSGNKLILDGAHIALSALPIEISGGKEITVEGWFWIDQLPVDNSEVFLFIKKEAFEATLRADSTLAFRIYKTPTATVELSGPVGWTLQAWHHLASMIDRRKGIAYVAIDGKIVFKAPFTEQINTNLNRFSIGGLQGKGSFIGMADEVRIAQAVRYPDVDFDPPKTLLIGDSPFLAGAINTIHGLWHFDEPVGVTLFNDFSLRGNDLFRIGEGGFQPFGTMRQARIGHQVTKLDDGSLWASGGYDSSKLPVDTTERLLVGDVGRSSVLFNTILIKGEPHGGGNGAKTDFDFTLAHKPISGSVLIKTTKGTNPLTATTTVVAFDLGDKTLAGTGISTGTIDYDKKEVTVKFPAALETDVSISADYNYNREGGSFHHTATKLTSGEVLIAGGESLLAGASNVTLPNNSAALFIPNGDAEDFFEVGSMSYARRYHAAISLSNGKALIVGGEGFPMTGTEAGKITTLATSEFFDPVSRTFPVGGAPFLSRPRKLHRIIALRDCDPSAPERFLVVGGYDEKELPLQEVEVYTAGVNFKPINTNEGKMETGRVRHAMSCLPNLPGFPRGRVLISGGIDPTGRILSTAEIYDPATESFTRLTTRMNSPRADHTMTLLPDGRVLIVGGFDQLGNVLATAEVYDMTADLFTYPSSFPGLGRYGHIALPWKGGAVDKDGVLLIGGANREGNVLPLLEMFYP